jgi:aminopeptidase N
MKKIVFLVLLSSIINHSMGQKPGAVIDVQHYTFAVTLNDDNNNIQGKATIEVLVLKNTQAVALELVSKRADGKGMTVQQVTEKSKTLVFHQSADSIHIDLFATAGEKRTFEISYEGIPADGLIIDNNKYKRRGFFADNWPNRARNWLPCVDHPADKASVDFLVTAPNHYQVVANGVQVEETSLDNNRKLTHYKETVPLPMKVMVIGVADFAVQYAGEVQCIPVYSWVYPEDKTKGFYDYAQAIEILPFFIRHVGPYGYKKLANVQSKTMFGGLENAGAIFYSENSVTGTRKSESLLTHEIAHQWFGDMATETEWAHIWLSEGFATYMTILYFEKKYGQDTARKMLLEDREQVISYTKRRLHPVVDSTVKDYMALLNPNSYQKGGWVLHMVRNRLGDPNLWKGIRAYYAKYSGKNASTDDLRKTMEEVSGQDLKQFFTQWLYTAGHPVLDIAWKYDKTRKSVTLTIIQKQDTPFQLPLELTFYGLDNKTILTKTVSVNDKQTSLTIPVTSPVGQLSVDPSVKLLFEGAIRAL